MEVGRLEAGRVCPRAAVQLGRVGEHNFAERRPARAFVNQLAAPITAVCAAAHVRPVDVERAESKAAHDCELLDDAHIRLILIVFRQVVRRRSRRRGGAGG